MQSSLISFAYVYYEAMLAHKTMVYLPQKSRISQPPTSTKNIRMWCGLVKVTLENLLFYIL